MRDASFAKVRRFLRGREVLGAKRIIQMNRILHSARAWVLVGIHLLLWTLPGCSTLPGTGSDESEPVAFEPVPPRSVQTESLRDVRFRRFASSETHNQSEWTSEPSIWPLEHPHRLVISRYGPRGRKLHKGIDIKAPKGTPIVATADGQVTFAGVRSGYGKVVEISHGDGIESVYAHMDSMDVTEGTTVLQGEIIGEVGDTGNASTPHVHYEVRIDAQCYDPWLFLPAVD